LPNPLVYLQILANRFSPVTVIDRYFALIDGGKVGRPALPLGTYGGIRVYSKRGMFRARTLYRDGDGVTRGGAPAGPVAEALARCGHSRYLTAAEVGRVPRSTAKFREQGVPGVGFLGLGFGQVVLNFAQRNAVQLCGGTSHHVDGGQVLGSAARARSALAPHRDILGVKQLHAVGWLFFLDVRRDREGRTVGADRRQFQPVVHGRRGAASRFAKSRR
jgi:hypothetical protein